MTIYFYFKQLADNTSESKKAKGNALKLNKKSNAKSKSTLKNVRSESAPEFTLEIATAAIKDDKASSFTWNEPQFLKTSISTEANTFVNTISLSLGLLDKSKLKIININFNEKTKKFSQEAVEFISAFINNLPNYSKIKTTFIHNSANEYPLYDPSSTSIQEDNLVMVFDHNNSSISIMPESNYKGDMVFYKLSEQGKIKDYVKNAERDIFKSLQLYDFNMQISKIDSLPYVEDLNKALKLVQTKNPSVVKNLVIKNLYSNPTINWQNPYTNRTISLENYTSFVDKVLKESNLHDTSPITLQISSNKSDYVIIDFNEMFPRLQETDTIVLEKFSNKNIDKVCEMINSEDEDKSQKILIYDSIIDEATYNKYKSKVSFAKVNVPHGFSRNLEDKKEKLPYEDSIYHSILKECAQLKKSEITQEPMLFTAYNYNDYFLCIYQYDFQNNQARKNKKGSKKNIVPFLFKSEEDPERRIIIPITLLTSINKKITEYLNEHCKGYEEAKKAFYEAKGRNSCMAFFAFPELFVEYPKVLKQDPERFACYLDYLIEKKSSFPLLKEKMDDLEKVLQSEGDFKEISFIKIRKYVQNSCANTDFTDKLRKNLNENEKLLNAVLDVFKQQWLTEDKILHYNGFLIGKASFARCKNIIETELYKEKYEIFKSSKELYCKAQEIEDQINIERFLNALSSKIQQPSESILFEEDVFEEDAVEEVDKAETKERNDPPKLRDVQLLNPISPEDETIESMVDDIVEKVLQKAVEEITEETVDEVAEMMVNKMDKTETEDEVDPLELQDDLSDSFQQDMQKAKTIIPRTVSKKKRRYGNSYRSYYRSYKDYNNYYDGQYRKDRNYNEDGIQNYTNFKLSSKKTVSSKMGVHKDNVPHEKNYKTINRSATASPKKDCKVANSFITSRAITSDFTFADIVNNVTKSSSVDNGPQSSLVNIVRDVDLEHNVIRRKAYSAALDDVYNMVQNAVYYSPMWNKICSIARDEVYNAVLDTMCPRLRNEIYNAVQNKTEHEVWNEAWKDGYEANNIIYAIPNTSITSNVPIYYERQFPQLPSNITQQAVNNNDINTTSDSCTDSDIERNTLYNTLYSAARDKITCLAGAQIYKEIWNGAYNTLRNTMYKSVLNILSNTAQSEVQITRDEIIETIGDQIYKSMVMEKYSALWNEAWWYGNESNINHMVPSNTFMTCDEPPLLPPPLNTSQPLDILQPFNISPQTFKENNSSLLGNSVAE